MKQKPKLQLAIHRLILFVVFFGPIGNLIAHTRAHTQCRTQFFLNDVHIHLTIYMNDVRSTGTVLVLVRQ